MILISFDCEVICEEFETIADFQSWIFETYPEIGIGSNVVNGKMLIKFKRLFASEE